MLGEFALRHQHLATAAQTAASADRVNVHAEAAGRLQQRRTHRKIAALPGWQEYDERIAGRHACSPLGWAGPMAAFAAAAWSAACRGARCGDRRLRVAKATNPASAIRIMA